MFISVSLLDSSPKGRSRSVSFSIGPLTARNASKLSSEDSATYVGFRIAIKLFNNASPDKVYCLLFSLFKMRVCNNCMRSRILCRRFHLEKNFFDSLLWVRLKVTFFLLFSIFSCLSSQTHSIYPCTTAVSYKSFFRPLTTFKKMDS